MSNAPDGATLSTLGSVSGGPQSSAISGAEEGEYNEGNPGKGQGGRLGESTALQGIPLPLSKVVTLGQLRIGFNSGHTIVPNSDTDSLLIAARQLDVDIFIWGGTHRVEAYQLEGKFFVNPGSATGAFYTGWPDPDEVEEEEGQEEKEEEEKSNGASSDKSKEETTTATATTSSATKESKDDESNTTSEKTSGSTEENDKKQSSGNGVTKKIIEVAEPKDPIPSFCLLDIQGSVCVVYIYQFIDGEVKVDKINYRKEE